MPELPQLIINDIFAAYRLFIAACDRRDYYAIACVSRGIRRWLVSQGRCPRWLVEHGRLCNVIAAERTACRALGLPVPTIEQVVGEKQKEAPSASSAKGAA